MNCKIYNIMLKFPANIAYLLPPLLKIKHLVPFYSKGSSIFNASIVKKKN